MYRLKTLHILAPYSTFYDKDFSQHGNYTMGWIAVELRFNSQQGQEINLFSMVPIPVLTVLKFSYPIVIGGSLPAGISKA
jgi:hypothetical protein